MRDRRTLLTLLTPTVPIHHLNWNYGVNVHLLFHPLPVETSLELLLLLQGIWTLSVTPLMDSWIGRGDEIFRKCVCVQTRLVWRIKGIQEEKGLNRPPANICSSGGKNVIFISLWDICPGFGEQVADILNLVTSTRHTPLRNEGCTDATIRLMPPQTELWRITHSHSLSTHRFYEPENQKQQHDGFFFLISQL